MKRLLIATLAILGACFLVPAGVARADVPGLQLHPLQYEDTLTTDAVKLGYVEVSNPSDANISLATSVQGFRQADHDGHLTFFDDPEISAGIKVDLPSFDLGPREAIRVAFNVDPTKLPKGGVYGVIFFRTIPPRQSSSDSYVAESANLGTLLLLQNGGDGAHIGAIKHLSMPFFQWGSGLKGSVRYANTDRSQTAVGFRPQLQARVLPWGHSPRFTTGLVLPSSERDFSFERSGAFIGLLPITVTDHETGNHRTAWVFAVTGWYQWVLMLLFLLALIIYFANPRKLWAQIKPYSRKVFIAASAIAVPFHKAASLAQAKRRRP